MNTDKVFCKHGLRISKLDKVLFYVKLFKMIMNSDLLFRGNLNIVSRIINEELLILAKRKGLSSNEIDSFKNDLN